MHKETTFTQLVHISFVDLTTFPYYINWSLNNILKLIIKQDSFFDKKRNTIIAAVVVIALEFQCTNGISRAPISLINNLSLHIRPIERVQPTVKGASSISFHIELINATKGDYCMMQVTL